MLWTLLDPYHQLCYTSSLTGGVVINIVAALGAVDPQEHLVVVVLVPVEGQDPGAAPLRVSTEEARHAGHELGERGGTAGLEQRGEGLQELLRALPLQQLWKSYRDSTYQFTWCSHDAGQIHPSSKLQNFRSGLGRLRTEGIRLLTYWPTFSPQYSLTEQARSGCSLSYMLTSAC